MKKYIKGIISILLAVTLLLPYSTAYGIEVTVEDFGKFDISGVELETEQHFVGSDITSNKIVASAIDYAMGKYPDQSVFPGKGELCVAYANKLNQMIASSNKVTKYYGKSIDEENVEKYVLGCKPGTILRFSYEKNGGSRGHSIVVLKATKDTVYWSECNRGGHNVVHYYKADFEHFVGYSSYFPYLTSKTEPVKYRTYKELNLAARTNPKTSEKELVWNRVNGAMSYNLYRADSKNGTYRKIASSAKAYFTDHTAVTGKNYYYQVKTKSNGKTIASSAKKVQYRKLNAPNLQGRLDGNTGILSWSKVDGADKYMVYEENFFEESTLLSEQTDTTYVIKRNDNESWDGVYTVKAICSSNEKYNSDFSPYCSIIYVNEQLQPQVKTTNLSDGSVQLSWNAFENGCLIYKSDKYLGKYYQVAELEDPNTTSWNDTCGKKGEKYYYFIMDSRASWNEEDKRSPIFSADFQNLTNTTPEYSRWRNLIGNSKIDAPTLSYEISSYGVRINWNAIERATSYKVIRKDVKSGKKKEFTTSRNSFLDKNALKGKTYEYEVKAQGDTGSIKSNSKTIRVKVS